MNILEKAAIIHYHRHRIKNYPGSKIGALGYRGEESQSKRFAALANVGDLNSSSLLDIGCGHGDLKGFVDERFHGFRYIGIDHMPEFIAQARSLYGQRPGCYFFQTDFTTAKLPRTDYVFASGVLSYRCSDTNFHFAMIAKMYRAAVKALAFNMLDAAKFPKNELLIGHDPDKVLAYCKTLSPDVRLVRDYLEDDFTLLMYRR